MKKPYDNLILTGSICIDRIMNFKGSYKDIIQPDKLHMLSLSVFIDKLTNSRGGTAANIAYSLALLGEKPVLMGSIGTEAKSYVQDLKTMGINTAAVHVSHLPTPTFTVLTDSENNQIGGFYPGAMSDIAKLSLKSWYKKHPLVVISANDPLAMDQLVSECCEGELDYIYDVGQQVTNITVTQLKHGLSHAKVLCVNDYELATIMTRTNYSEAELNQLIPVIVTTLGAKGTKITGSSIKQARFIKALDNIQVVDPTGAGDGYRAGFLYGYLRDWDLSVCAGFGSVIASYTISQHGTQNHRFTVAQVREKYYSTYGEKL